MLFGGDDSWGVAPGWDDGAPLALSWERCWDHAPLSFCVIKPEHLWNSIANLARGQASLLLALSEFSPQI